MKKSLLALAVLGAFSGTAMGQTGVTLYGRVDAGIGVADSDTPGGDETAMLWSGVQSATRIGIRGTEDLGSGLQVTFNIEAGIEVDTGELSNPTRMWARRAVVGLAGAFGEINVGRDYTPGYRSIGTTDVMDLGLFGNWKVFSSNGGITTRASNGLHYVSPEWSGLTLRAMYAAGEADDVSRPSGDGDMYGLSGVYENGRLTAQAYYQSRKFDNGLNDTDRVDEYGAGAQYRFGAYRVALGYGMADTGLPGGGSVKHDAWSIGLDARLGVGEVLFNYVAQEVDLAGDPKATSFGIAYVHPVSKHTNFYVSYGRLDNDRGADFTLRASASRTAVGGTVNAEPKAFAIGILHHF
ncbi:MAG TPA: porin [Zeimonas sp.]|nr:porin [Zeimonas sp.]